MPSNRTDRRFLAFRRVAEAGLVAVALVAAATHGILLVQGGSMEPSVSSGDVIVYRRGATALEAGDLVVFEHRDALVVHRVAALLRDGALRTRGDANSVADVVPVEAAAVRGEVRIVLPTAAVASRLAGLTP
jgi:signal peptidase I